MSINRVTEASLPTPWGEFLIVGFEEQNSHKDHLALIYGDISDAFLEPVLVRIHSECLTGDALFSLRCDCGFQLETSLEKIAKNGRGLLVYHRQEGRNIGLLNKIRAYALQDSGLDTVEANHRLGFSADERDFTICADILKNLGVNKIRLLTNNPQKEEALRNSGIDIVERISLIVGKNENNAHYLATKATKMGHLFAQESAIVLTSSERNSKMFKGLPKK